jgi:hypothetical protein
MIDSRKAQASGSQNPEKKKKKKNPQAEQATKAKPRK